ncbi:MAG TPA: winged helix DNA-binding protein [Candidatus Anaerofilum faecale]|nr:winged helix DNA-binding protein [Candidatus Anaerofilum faecale]
MDQRRWGMTREDKKNAYLYCKFRDEQFALYDEYAKRNGMMMKTLLVVNVLFYAEDGMTQKEICRRTFQSKQTVNLIIKNLLAETYVTVTEVPENKRNKIVQLTDAGRAYCEKVVRHITWAEDTAMSMFTPEEQKLLIDLSRTFTKNLTRLVNQEGEELEDGSL